jgi:hypothetical protein
MTTMTPAPGSVTGGVNTHLDVHVAAAVDHPGGVLGTETFPTTSSGYRRLLRWLGLFRAGARSGSGGHRELRIRTRWSPRRRGVERGRGVTSEPAGPPPAWQDRRCRRDHRRASGPLRPGPCHREGAQQASGGVASAENRAAECREVSDSGDQPVAHDRRDRTR